MRNLMKLALGVLAVNGVAHAELEFTVENPYALQFSSEETKEVDVSVSSDGLVTVLTEGPFQYGSDLRPNARAYFKIADNDAIWDYLDLEIQKRTTRDGTWLYKVGETIFCQIHPAGNKACMFNAKLEGGYINPQYTPH